MRVGTASRYESLKRDQEHVMHFGFVSSDESGDEAGAQAQRFEITSQHLEDNASICSSIPQSEHAPSSKRRRMQVGDDGVVYESIVVNNEPLDDAESKKRQEEKAEEASKQLQLLHNKNLYDKAMKSKRMQKGLLKGKIKQRKLQDREECIEDEPLFIKSNLV